MTERGDTDPDGPDDDRGMGLRLVRAVEVLARAQATHAGEEAKRDLGRIGSGLMLLALAASLAGLAVLLLHVAFVLILVERVGLSLAVACGAVASVDLLLGMVLALIARARVRAPVMRETRATFRRAVHVLRG